MLSTRTSLQSNERDYRYSSISLGMFHLFVVKIACHFLNQRYDVERIFKCDEIGYPFSFYIFVNFMVYLCVLWL